MSYKLSIKNFSKWVAYTQDRKKIVEDAKTLKQLITKTKGKEDLIFSYIPPAGIHLSP